MKGAIFDLDGTLIGSMAVWDKVDYDLLKRYGAVPDEEYNQYISSCTFSEGIDYIINRYGISKTPNELSEEMNEMAYDEYANKLMLKDGAYEAIIRLKNSGVRLGMATSSIRSMCEAVLKRNKVFDYFEVILFSDEIGKNKTNPDIYIEAANRLGIEPKNCVVFEDVIFAAKSAKEAGMTVIGVFDQYSAKHSEQMKSICDKFIYSFDEVGEI